MSRALPFLLVLAFLAAGCFGGGGDGGGSSISPAKGDSLVLSQSDVGAPFIQFDKGAQRLSDLSPPRDKPERFGRKGGWQARFRRQGTSKTDGPLVISSLADVFGSNGGARKDFELYKLALGEFVTTGGKSVSAPGLGDESDAVTFRQGLPPNVVDFYVIAWRDGNVTASINANGFKLTLEQALVLSRAQERRIRAAR